MKPVFYVEPFIVGCVGMLTGVLIALHFHRGFGLIVLAVGGLVIFLGRAPRHDN